jgi:transketolase C-terminal domain/subunit
MSQFEMPGTGGRSWDVMGASLHSMHYNFAIVHKPLGITPAMAAGITHHVWSLEEIAMLADAAFVPTKRGPYKQKLGSGDPHQ